MYDDSFGLLSSHANADAPLQPSSPSNPQVDLFSPDDLNQFLQQDVNHESKDGISTPPDSNISQDFSLSAIGLKELASPFTGVDGSDQGLSNAKAPSRSNPTSMMKSCSDSPVYNQNKQGLSPSKAANPVNTSATMALSTPRQANGQRRFNWAEMICYTIDESPDGKLFVQDLFERMVKKSRSSTFSGRLANVFGVQSATPPEKVSSSENEDTTNESCYQDGDSDSRTALRGSDLAREGPEAAVATLRAANETLLQERSAFVIDETPSADNTMGEGEDEADHDVEGLEALIAGDAEPSLTSTA